MRGRTYFEVVEVPGGVDKIRFVCPVFDHSSDPPPPEPLPYVPARLFTEQAVMYMRARSKAITYTHSSGDVLHRVTLPSEVLCRLGKCTIEQAARLRRQQARRMREYLYLSQYKVAHALGVSRAGIHAAETTQMPNSAVLMSMLAYLKEQIKQKALEYKKYHDSRRCAGSVGTVDPESRRADTGHCKQREGSPVLADGWFTELMGEYRNTVP